MERTLSERGEEEGEVERTLSERGEEESEVERTLSEERKKVRWRERYQRRGGK